MTRRKLERLKREWAQLRRSPQRAAALQGLANRLGRALVNRGRHPMWESTEFSELYALSIPDHGAKDLAPGTRNSILDQLQDDLLAWERRVVAAEEDDAQAQGDDDENTGGDEDGAQ